MTQYMNGFGLGPALVQGADPVPTPGTHAATCVEGIALLRGYKALIESDNTLGHKIADRLIANLHSQLDALGYTPR